MADFSELFRTTEEQLTPLDAEIEGEFFFILFACRHVGRGEYWVPGSSRKFFYSDFFSHSGSLRKDFVDMCLCSCRGDIFYGQNDAVHDLRMKMSYRLGAIKLS